jgi:uncharacterized surface protein with fasciclin (FAS1) repeats
MKLKPFFVSFVSADKMYTVFAPYNPAFDKMNSDDRTSLFKDKAKLAKFVHNHVLTQGYSIKDFTDGMTLTTMDKQDIKVSVVDNKITLTLPNGNKVELMSLEYRCKNGYVMMPKSVMW